MNVVELKRPRVGNTDFWKYDPSPEAEERAHRFALAMGMPMITHIDEVHFVGKLMVMSIPDGSISVDEKMFFDILRTVDYRCATMGTGSVYIRKIFDTPFGRNEEIGYYQRTTKKYFINPDFAKSIRLIAGG